MAPTADGKQHTVSDAIHFLYLLRLYLFGAANINKPAGTVRILQQILQQKH